MIEELRKKGRLTRMLLLLQMVTESPKDQRSLADPIGITPQAVSDYLNKMKQEDLVTTGTEGPRPTVKGVDLLHQDLLSWKGFIDSSINRLEIVRSTDAMALESITRGDVVHLIMKDGLLSAVKEGKGSSGIAETDASPGDMLTISSLSGLVDLEPGRIHLAEIPSIRSGGGKGTIRMDDAGEISSRDGNDLRVVAMDLEAVALLKRSSITYDLEMPPPEALIFSSMRGIELMAFGTQFSISTFLRTMENRNMDLPIIRSQVKPSV